MVQRIKNKGKNRLSKVDYYVILTSFCKICLLHLTNGFHVAVRLFSNKKVAHEAQPSGSPMFLPHFDVLCDLLLNRRTATWDLFVLYSKE